MPGHLPRRFELYPALEILFLLRRGMSRSHSITLTPRWRIYLGTEIALGPGKARLLKAIQENGSLLLAARSLEMSYMRAWKLAKTMNACFDEPLVLLARGGKSGGSARLSQRGEAVLRLYEQLERASTRATQSIQREVVRLLKSGS